MELKSEICSVLKEDVSNFERQKLGELFSFIDIILLDKFGKVHSKDYNSLYKELIGKLVKNPKDLDTKLVLERIKYINETQEGFYYMKFLQMKLILKAYDNATKIIEIIDKINNTEEV
jgi:hypothetical protein